MGFETKQAGVWFSALDYNKHVISEPSFSITEMIVIMLMFIITIIIIINDTFTALFERLN